MARYYGDVKDDRACEAVCEEDVQCLAYSYGFPRCSIFGTVRTEAPVRSVASPMTQWAFQEGSDPPAIIVDAVAPLGPEQLGEVCRVKSRVQVDLAFGLKPVDLVFGLPSITILLILFFCCLFSANITVWTKRTCGCEDGCVAFCCDLR